MHPTVKYAEEDFWQRLWRMKCFSCTCFSAMVMMTSGGKKKRIAFLEAKDVEHQMRENYCSLRVQNAT